MADTSFVAQPFITAGSGIGVPTQHNYHLGPSIVRRILITYPPGCGGLVGIRIQAGMGDAFPNQPGQFMLFDDYTYAFDVTNQIDSGQWTVLTYNTDAIDRVVQVVFEYDYLRGFNGQTSDVAIAL